MVELGQLLAHFWPTSANVGPHSTKFGGIWGRTWNNVADFGGGLLCPTLVEFGRMWPEDGQHLANLGQVWAKFGRCSPIPRNMYPNLGSRGNFSTAFGRTAEHAAAVSGGGICLQDVDSSSRNMTRKRAIRARVHKNGRRPLCQFLCGWRQDPAQDPALDTA